jgi:UDP:flavonoid glycosyltransferase YjiC (YdhE family)
LKALGHEPLLATCAVYRDLVEHAGVAFHPVPPDVNPNDTSLIRRVMDPLRGPEVVVREITAPAVREAFAAIDQAARGADLLLSHPVTFAAPLVGDARQLPWLSTVLAPTSFFSMYDSPILPPALGLARLSHRSRWIARGFLGLARRATTNWTAPVVALRRELGLADRGNPLFEGQFSPRGTLALFSPLFGSPQPDWPRGTVATGFIFHQGRPSADERIPEFLDRGNAPVVFTLGSSAVGSPGDFYRESVAAAKRAGRRAVLLMGPAARDFGETADILPVEYAPHHEIFPKASVIVHHGGIGTTAEALAGGRPMIVVPHAHDQFDNAFRAERLGVARTLDARRYSSERAARLLVALEDPGVVQRAKDVALKVRSENGVDVAAAQIVRQAAAVRNR